jgi:hypothetical protein
MKPSEVALKYGRMIERWSYEEPKGILADKAAIYIDSASHEIARPLVEAVQAYASSVGNESVSIKDGADLFLAMLAEVQKLKGGV